MPTQNNKKNYLNSLKLGLKQREKLVLDYAEKAKNLKNILTSSHSNHTAHMIAKIRYGVVMILAKPHHKVRY